METDAKRAQTKITYATMTADRMEEIHEAYDRAVNEVRQGFGKNQSMFINGRAVSGGPQFEQRSPIDTRVVIARFPHATVEQVEEAISAARTAFRMWSRVPWEERVRVVRRIGEKLRARRTELAASIGWEVGKNRFECLGEVEEAADFFDYYCNQMEQHDGYTRPMGSPGSPEESASVLRPYGVWGLIAPFNFPLALAAGPTAAALVTGNTVVFKPATDTALIGLRLYELVAEEVPPGVFNFVTGEGKPVGEALVNSPEVDGVVFTGSKAVGMHLLKENAARAFPRPLIIEMGGKNPTIVMESADLDKATDGVLRSAFGAQGQKCSACSRVYVDDDVRDQFVRLLVEKTKKISVGNPLERDVFMGPVINQRALKTYEDAIERAQRDGGKVLVGGHRITTEPFTHGYFVEPTVVDGLPKDHAFFTDELFVPILAVGKVKDIDQAIAESNRAEYGLTAGIFTAKKDEIQKYFDEIEAGVCYANRKTGATTGAWPGVQSFCGWKGSGSTGKGGCGPYYVTQFMREQSRTIME